MSLDSLKDFFLDKPLWQKVAAGLIVALIIAIVGAVARRSMRRKKEPEASHVPVEAGDDASTQVAGDGAKQDMRINRSTQEATGGGIIIKDSPGAVVIVNPPPPYSYQDGVATSPIADVRTQFAEGLEHYEKGEFEKAIEKFRRCLRLEPDAERRGALSLQIGNCYYGLRRYAKALESYGKALAEARQVGDQEGQAAALGSIGNAYCQSPASTGEFRGRNVRTALDSYQKALEIFDKLTFPVQYATTQNNLGNAYGDLPAATAEERAANVRKGIEAYREALGIRKKDQYPVQYAGTQNNLGTAYMDLPAATAEERAANVRK
ncbi:MAG: tetratricopeptide repeat protein, partial [Chloroflexota bacterium]|nr:tetratricopeptide repeat protein [Chloroflexota bacterium]